MSQCLNAHHSGTVGDLEEWDVQMFNSYHSGTVGNGIIIYHSGTVSSWLPTILGQLVRG